MRARTLRLSNCRGAFFTGPGSLLIPSRTKEGRKEGRKSGDVGEVPEAAAEKIGSRYRRRQSSLPKTIAPTSGAIAGFIPTFCRVILFNAASNSPLRLNYSNSVLRSFPVTRSRRKPRAHASLLVRHVYPEIFTPWRFPIAFSASLLLSILMPHASKRPSNSARAHRSSDKCRSCNSATSERSEWARLSENRCSRMHCVKSSINFGSLHCCC